MRRVRTGAADPVRDWYVLIRLSAIALLGIIVFHVWAFDTVARGGTLGGRAPSTPVAIDDSSLTKIRTIFADRAGEASKYTSGTYKYADPSQ